MPFQKGHKLATGGKREGAGRPADWLKEKCQEIVQKEKLIEFMGDVAAGKEFPQLATGDGEVLLLPPSIKDRRAATEWLVDRGYGKVSQPVEGSLEIGKTVWLLPDGFKNPSEQKPD